MSLINISNMVSQLLSQPLPSYLNLKSFLFSLFDDSYPLETRSLSDFLANSNISTFWNDILSAFKYIGEDLPSMSSLVLIIFIFSKMYTSVNSNTLMFKTLEAIKRLLAFNILYLFTYHIIRCSLQYVPDYFQTKHWLAPATRNFFINDTSVYFNFSILFFIFFVFLALHSFINSLKLSAELSSEVPILTFLIACFSISLLDTTDFGLLIVCLEGFSLTLYILATTGRTYGGVTASIKYFVFGTLGSILLYWGGLGLFEISATMKLNTFKELTELYSSQGLFNSNMYLNLIWSQNCILIGFLIKLGAAPLHQWIADVYAGVPLFITAFYATFVKLVLFVVFLQFATNFISTKEVEYAALLSLIVGCFGALRQVEIKRFLAYSSITHTGYLLMGDLSSAYVYVVTYIFASILFFSVLLNQRLNSKEFIYLSDLRFIGQSQSQLSRVVLTIALASMAGLPPFAGFYGKMTVWVSLIEDIYLFNDSWSYILFTANILISLVAMFYYAQVMCILFVNNENNKNTIISSNQISTNKLINWFQIVGTLLITFWAFLMPYIFAVIQSTI